MAKQQQAFSECCQNKNKCFKQPAEKLILIPESSFFFFFLFLPSLIKKTTEKLKTKDSNKTRL